MHAYTFWNNKGGTGKTSLAFQTICRFAQQNPDRSVLVIDVCPQANLSELFLGGLGVGNQRLLEFYGQTLRQSIGGYFQRRIPAPFSPPAFNAADFIVRPYESNASIPPNIFLVCGDPLLELQGTAISSLANQSLPGTNAWLGVVSWLKDFIDPLEFDYDVVFMDANPSFSFYTQICLAATTRLILPVMADDSSRRAIQNAFSLTYGLRLPSEIYAEYAFSTRLAAAGRELPQVHVIAKNRLTQYMGPASAYSAVLQSIDTDVTSLIEHNSEIFSFENLQDGVVEIRDFQTTGVVAFAKGMPFYNLSAGRMNVGGQRVRVNREQIDHCMSAVDDLVAKIAL
ncbi:ParA family protein [Luteimonas salinilitoris]|uniref:ParA family protein n=1 Tax=Luteimonas salinilitoris TaxID=3237697 RepID=A0ABV4HVR9_9GAMM